MRNRTCTESQGDGVPCQSVRVACEECVRARPIHKRTRRPGKPRQADTSDLAATGAPAIATDPKAPSA
jgi:hypothetical protein